MSNSFLTSKNQAYAVPVSYESFTAERFTVSFDHSACSYGQPVLVRNGVAYGPGDLHGGLVQHFGHHRDALTLAGFLLTETIREQLSHLPGAIEESEAR